MGTLRDVFERFGYMLSTWPQRCTEDQSFFSWLHATRILPITLDYKGRLFLSAYSESDTERVVMSKALASTPVQMGNWTPHMLHFNGDKSNLDAVLTRHLRMAHRRTNAPQFGRFFINGKPRQFDKVCKARTDV